MRWSISLFLLAQAASGGAIDFGLDELQRAIAARKLPAARTRFSIEISMNAKPESYEIAGTRISGGDRRGLLYGLLAAADQVRTQGRLMPVRTEPVVPIRGLRYPLSKLSDSRDVWIAWFQSLARAQVNRFTLAPPTLTGMDSELLRVISDLAVDYCVDLYVEVPPGEESAVGPLLSDCPAIRGVRTRTPPTVAPALRQIGRLVVLEIPEGYASPASDLVTSVLAPFSRNGGLRAYPDRDPFVSSVPVVYDLGLLPDLVDDSFVSRLHASIVPSGGSGFEGEIRELSADFASLWGHPSGQRASSVLRAAAHAEELLNGALGPAWDAVQKLHADALLLERTRAPEPLQSQLRAKGAYVRQQARLLLGLEFLKLYEQTRHDTALLAARRELTAAKAVEPLRKVEQLLQQHEAVELAPLPWPDPQKRPTILHQAPASAVTGAPLVLSIRNWPNSGEFTARLRYRLVGLDDSFRVKELPARNAVFTIPANELSAPGRLVYQFEFIHSHVRWLEPDPESRYPFYSVEVKVPVSKQ